MSTSHNAESACVTVVVVVLVVVVLSTLGIEYSRAEKEAKPMVRIRRVARAIFVPFIAWECGRSLP